MVEPVSFGAAITALAAKRPDDVALIHVAPDGSERSATYLELDRRSNQVARLLEARGVGPGAIVVIALPNALEHYYCAIATWKLGATPLPLRWDLPLWERERIYGLAAPRAVIGCSDTPWSGELRPDDIQATVGLDASALPDRIPQPVRAIASSGSTGKPKLIITPSAGVVSDTAVINDLMSRMGLGDGVTQLLVSPLYHTNGFNSHFGLQKGQKIIVQERFDAAQLLDLMEKYRANYIVMVPVMLQRVANAPGVESRDFSSIKAIHYGGATIPDWLVRKWFEFVGPEHFFFAYGGTEGIGVTFNSGTEWLAHEGTTGRGVRTQIRIQDEQGRELGPRDVGNVFLKREGAVGRSFEYVGAARLSETEDGFSTFGDMGWLDEDGYLYIVDRRSDMIVSGGVNIFPAEVETAVSEHPDVADVVVIGLRDAEWGRRVHAIVEPKDASAPPTPEALAAHCRARLMPYKVPKSFELVDRIPRTTAGKVSRQQLAEDRTPG
jgi:bile acid-coenzyme A ligase